MPKVALLQHITKLQLTGALSNKYSGLCRYLSNTEVKPTFGGLKH